MKVCEARHCTGIHIKIHKSFKSNTARLKHYNINKALIKLQVSHWIVTLQNAFHCMLITVTAPLFAYKLRAKPK